MIPLTWLVFAITDMQGISLYISRLFPFLGDSERIIFQGDFIKYLRLYMWPFVGAIVCCSGLPRKLYEKKKNSFLTAFVLVLLFWLCIYSMYIGLHDPFLYYQF
jgi:alginate O-acetyltransferase complex protein AlgI